MGGIIVFILVAFVTWLKMDQSNCKVKMPNLAFENIEALANGEGIDGIVIKKCYTTFTPGYDGNYYATCSVVSNLDILYECGAISANMPAWNTLPHECYHRVN